MEDLTYSFSKRGRISKGIWLLIKSGIAATILVSIFVFMLSRLFSVPLLTTKAYTNPGICAVPIGMQRAMLKMGPGYKYRIIKGDVLQVDKGNGKWLRLRYRRR